jgi:polyisoprenoid-binding protein YceI
MRLSSLVTIAAIVVGLAGAPAANAAPEAFSINKPHTIVAFTVERLGLTKMLGSFSKVDGEFSIDQNDPNASKIDLIIDTSSVYTGFEPRDKDLRSPNFFNVQEFPQMKFVSTKVEKTGDKTAKVTGDFTLLGVTKPVTLDVVLNGIKKDPKTQKDMAGFSAKGVLKRSDFGMKYLVGPIGDEVTLMVELLGDQK